MDDKVNILFVEDSEDDVILITYYIKQRCNNLFHKRIETRDDLLLELTQDETWDLIVCDNSLPQLTGLEAIKIIREKHKEIPIVAVSGSNLGANLKEILKAGATAIITKDDLEKIAEVICEIILKRKCV